MKATKPPVKKFNLRLPVDLMEQAQQQADALGVSLNAYCLLAIRNFIGWTEKQTQASQRARAAAPKAAAAWREAPTGTSAPPRVGPNAPCPCGSGLKAKRCHPEACGR